MEDLKGKVALVTGCARGIGKAIVKRFTDEGAIVYANAKRIGCIDEFAEKINCSSKGQVIPVYFDVTNKDGIKSCIMRIKKDYNRLDILVNNAGVMKDALIGMVDDTTLYKTFEVNVFAIIHITQMAMKLMKKDGGTIINLSSIVGVRGSAGQTVYAASKGAVANITKTWARELVKDNIRVNAIAPGKIDTDMYKSIGEEKVRDGISEVGMKRLGDPDEVAKVALFLATDLSSYVTGEVIGVNGGWFL